MSWAIDKASGLTFTCIFEFASATWLWKPCSISFIIWSVAGVSSEFEIISVIDCLISSWSTLNWVPIVTILSITSALVSASCFVSLLYLSIISSLFSMSEFLMMSATVIVLIGASYCLSNWNRSKRFCFCWSLVLHRTCTLVPLSPQH